MPIQEPESPNKVRSTTILSVRHAGAVVMAGDGQVSVGQTIMKRGARKVRRLYNDRVAGGLCRQYRRRAHALRQVRGQGSRSSTAICGGPRSRWPRIGAPIGCCAGSRRCWWSRIAKIRCWSRARATLSSPTTGCSRSGRGVISRWPRRAPWFGTVPVSSARQIAEGAMKIAAEICVYTNDQFTFEEL